MLSKAEVEERLNDHRPYLRRLDAEEAEDQALETALALYQERDEARRLLQGWLDAYEEYDEWLMPVGKTRALLEVPDAE